MHKALQSYVLFNAIAVVPRSDHESYMYVYNGQ